jgi:hypothetical protein
VSRLQRMGRFTGHGQSTCQIISRRLVPLQESCSASRVVIWGAASAGWLRLGELGEHVLHEQRPPVPESHATLEDILHLKPGMNPHNCSEVSVGQWADCDAFCSLRRTSTRRMCWGLKAGSQKSSRRCSRRSGATMWCASRRRSSVGRWSSESTARARYRPQVLTRLLATGRALCVPGPRISSRGTISRTRRSFWPRCSTASTRMSTASSISPTSRYAGRSRLGRPKRGG